MTWAFPTCRWTLWILPTSCNTLTQPSLRNLDNSEFSSLVGWMPARQLFFSEFATWWKLQKSTTIEGKRYGFPSWNMVDTNAVDMQSGWFCARGVQGGKCHGYHKWFHSIIITLSTAWTTQYQLWNGFQMQPEICISWLSWLSGWPQGWVWQDEEIHHKACQYHCSQEADPYYMVSWHTLVFSANFNISRYYIPMDQHHCAVSVAEERFFGECNARKGDEFIFIIFSTSLTWVTVPVVVLFTK